jgi:uncharacterized SAM-binding protein YcdF (DUF218 family)
MFLFKKIVSQFFFPMPICLGLCFTGLALLWWSKKQKAGKVLVTSGLLILTALSSSPVANILVRPMERRFPVYRANGAVPVPFVVVLGGGHSSDPNVPAGSQLADETAKRLLEGIRIHRLYPSSKLVLSGGAGFDRVADATVMAEVAQSLGVSSSEMRLETESRDTLDEARLLKGMLSTNRFVLVTSAIHMPRSMKLFRGEGLQPDPAPAQQLVKAGELSPGWFFPSGSALILSEHAFYESIGTVWYRLRSRGS